MDVDHPLARRCDQERRNYGSTRQCRRKGDPRHCRVAAKQSCFKNSAQGPDEQEIAELFAQMAEGLRWQELSRRPHAKSLYANFTETTAHGSFFSWCFVATMKPKVA